MASRKAWSGSGHYCAAINCSNCRKRNPTLHFFRFPRDTARAQTWASKIGRQDLSLRDGLYLYKNCYVCQLHFEDVMFMNVAEKKSLIPAAVPTLIDVPKSKAPLSNSRPVPTDIYCNVDGKLCMEAKKTDDATQSHDGNSMDVSDVDEKNDNNSKTDEILNDEHGSDIIKLEMSSEHHTDSPDESKQNDKQSNNDCTGSIPVSKEQPRRRGRRSARGNARKAFSADRKNRATCKAEVTETQADNKPENGDMPGKCQADEFTKNTQSGTDQVTQKLGRVIRTPKMLSSDFELTPEKKRFIGRGRRSQAEAVSASHTREIAGELTFRVREQVNPKWLLPFDHGWRREIVVRNMCTDKKTRPADVYYCSPHGGRKLRSIPEICRHLRETNSKLTTDCFTFIKELIHKEPAEVARCAGKALSNKSKEEISTKLPKSPVAKQRKIFHKSPLAQKRKSSLSSAKTKQELPEVITEPEAIQHPAESDQTISSAADVKDEEQSKAPINSVAPPLADDECSDVAVTSQAQSSKPVEIRQSSVVKNGLKPAVTKKHTVKRLSGITDENATGPVAHPPKKYKTGGQQRLCGMDCPGRHGVPPSLHCNVCMCMFHPECIGKQSLQRFDGFVCRSCKVMNRKLRDLPPSASVPLPGPPPLQVSPSPNPNLLCPPPPLRAAPTAGGLDGLRGPPPLRMAPVSNMPPVSPSPVALSSMVRLTSMPLPSVVPDIGCSQPVGMLPSTSLCTAITTPSIAPVQSDLLLSMSVPAPAPVSLTAPAMVPKDVSGQILALPKNITARLNLGKPISLKVNDQSFVLSPNCFVSTEEGAKVYLPDGCLPGNMTQGTDSPLSMTLNGSSEKQEQIISVSSYSNKATSWMQERKASKCFRSYIQPLHAGFDCMIKIFHYLGLADLLRASQVCKTWNKVSAQYCLWKKIQLHGCKISNWEIAAKKMKYMHTEVLDLREMLVVEDFNDTWHLFISVLPHLVYLQHVEFGQCPSNVLQAIVNNIQHLEGLVAEFITDTLQEPEIWTTSVRLDIGKFARLQDLRVLKLRGICGIMVSTSSNEAGLGQLSALKQLKMLSLTTLQDVPEQEFGFLESLTDLEELELGDIEHWTPETYSKLSKMTNLRHLRLEGGTDYEEHGLGEALLSMKQLNSLELINFTVSKSLVENLADVKTLKSLTVWPDTKMQPALVNTCTLQAVRKLNSLTRLDWGVVVKKSADDSLDHSPRHDTSDGTSGSKAESEQEACIPFLQTECDLDKVEDSKQDLENVLDHLTVNQLVDRLCNLLPNTKIRVFKVPVTSNRRAS